MVSSLIALMVGQTQNTPQTTPFRDLHPGLQRGYRVKIDQQGGDDYSYRLNIKVVAPKGATGPSVDTKLELKLTNYRATMQGQSVSLGKIGAGMLPIGADGLPIGLEIVGPQGPVWLPMLAFYNPPTSEDGAFPLDRTPVGGNMFVSGTGTLSHSGKKVSLSFEMTFSREKKDLGQASIQTSLDSKGWPQKAEGTLKSADGVFHFTLEPG